MKKFLSLTLALVMTMALAVPAFATDIPPVASTNITAPDDGIMPLFDLYSENASATDSGEWTSGEFSATSSHGNYIRYWHKNNTDEKVKVYLYRTDKSTTTHVSMMYVDANDQNSKVYYTPTAGSGTYKIVIEAYVSGGAISGGVSAAQYKTNPDL